MKILAINGSYRPDGYTDQTLEAFAGYLRAAGADFEVICPRTYPIEFCLNCRACTQQPGTVPEECVHHDGMRQLIDKIEEADCFILAAPTNMGSVTAVFKCFMERLAVYAYWPWERSGNSTARRRPPKKSDFGVLLRCARHPGSGALRDTRATENDGKNHWRRGLGHPVQRAGCPRAAPHLAEKIAVADQNIGRKDDLLRGARNGETTCPQ